MDLAGGSYKVYDLSQVDPALYSGFMWVVVAHCNRCRQDIRMDRNSCTDQNLVQVSVDNHEARCYEHHQWKKRERKRERKYRKQLQQIRNR